MFLWRHLPRGFSLWVHDVFLVETHILIDFKFWVVDGSVETHSERF